MKASHRSLLLSHNCVNLYPTFRQRYGKMKYMPVHAKYKSDLQLKYPSIVHLWNDWYNSYVNTTDFPRLVVRMEDVVFRAEVVLPKVCECFGGRWRHQDRNEVRYHTEVANQNTGIDTSAGSGLLRSIIRYGNRNKRRQHYQVIQFEAARQLLDPKLMAMFGYSYEPP